jgi:hypothetical protein
MKPLYCRPEGTGDHIPQSEIGLAVVPGEDVALGEIFDLDGGGHGSPV